MVSLHGLVSSKLKGSIKPPATLHFRYGCNEGMQRDANRKHPATGIPARRSRDCIHGSVYQERVDIVSSGEPTVASSQGQRATDG
jgi:hypothetical protein